MRRVLILLAAAALAAVDARAGGTADTTRGLATPAATRTLVQRLKAAGRGEARITQTTPDPTGGPARVDRGTLTLEPPDRARIDFHASGEALTVRADGGEWLQPAARQMLRLSPEQAAEAARIWSILVAGHDAFAERKLGPRRYALLPRAGEASVDSAWIELDQAGLPARAELFAETVGKVTVVFSGWTFGRPRGAAAFRLEAPAGFAIVDLP